MFKFGNSSEKSMIGVHSDLVIVARRALELSQYDFGIGNTSVRTSEEQSSFVARGLSKTMNSRHVPENNECRKSCAIDIFIYDSFGQSVFNLSRKEQHGYFRKVGQAFVTAAIEEGIQIELGMLWQSFVDGPHIQLRHEDYP